MGADFATLYVSSQDKKKIKSQFEAEQDSDRHENGHSYSGGLGMAPGLTIDDSKTYDSEENAYDYLIDKCQKWENAIGVPYRDGDKIVYLIGAWCSS